MIFPKSLLFFAALVAGHPTVSVDRDRVAEIMQIAQAAVVNYALDHRRNGPFDDVFLTCRKWYARFPNFAHELPLVHFAIFPNNYPPEYDRLASFSVELMGLGVEGFQPTAIVTPAEWREIAHDTEVIRERVLGYNQIQLGGAHVNST